MRALLEHRRVLLDQLHHLHGRFTLCDEILHQLRTLVTYSHHPLRRVVHNRVNLSHLAHFAAHQLHIAVAALRFRRQTRCPVGYLTRCCGHLSGMG
ncbi:hypothetical protein D3C75_1052740 [compost metagenome]